MPTPGHQWTEESRRTFSGSDGRMFMTWYANDRHAQRDTETGPVIFACNAPDVGQADGTVFSLPLMTLEDAENLIEGLQVACAKWREDHG